jgi:citrate lyase subunit beta/citryl-CoA lyase
MGDYSASQRMQSQWVGGSGGYGGDIWHYPRYKMTIACRANGIDPVDGPYANFRNPDEYRQEAERANALGMVGKWAIHPSQVDIAHGVFAPSPAAVADARKQKAAYDDALAKGLGAINVDGVMVDAASIRIIQNTIDRADLVGL